MKISIKNKIILFFTLFVSLILIGQLIFNLFLAKDYYIHYKGRMMEEIFHEIKNNFDNSANKTELMLSPYENQEGIDIVIRSEAGELIYASFGRYFEQEVRDLNHVRPMEDFESGALIFEPEPKAEISKRKSGEVPSLKLQGVFEYQGENYYANMAVPMVAIENSVIVFTKSSMMISIVVLMIGVLLSFVLSRDITKPLKEIEGVATQVAELDFSKKANENISTEELASLAKSINLMSDELEQSIAKLNDDIDYQRQIEQMRREFVANVSHEMKTPLALLQMYAINLKNRTPNIDMDYYLDTIVEETERLNDMVVSMLQISSIESGLSKMNFEEIDVSRLCSEETEKCVILLEDYDVEINITPDLYLEGDYTYLGQAMKNFITNAAEHAIQGGIIRIFLEKTAGGIKFGVFNEGNQIKDDDIVHIWESFYRSDKARVRSGKNVGLGLHIVKTIVEKHKGVCNVENLERGVVFSFEISQ